MKEILFWLAIKNIFGIGDVTFKKLLEEYGDIENIYKSVKNESEKRRALEFAKSEYEEAEKLGIKFLTYNDTQYPQQLRNIYSPPPVLYCLGNTELIGTEEILSIVGTRNPTDYGRNICSEIVREISKFQITTVSGLARGIDTIVHEETMKNGSRTVAVLGCGVNIIYPASNRKLFNEIKDNGLIISEFPLNTKPEPGNFPKRNRIISGLAKGVVVVEASKKSGSLITAEFALNQGKDLFAIPGNVYSYKSKGTNYLIKNGAYLTECANDVVEVLFPYKVNEESCENIQTEAPVFDSPQLEDLYKIIREKPVNIDELVIKTGLSIPDITVLLSNLQLLGHITEQTGKVYVANR